MSSNGVSGNGTAQAHAIRLMEAKEVIERELNRLYGILDTNGVTMNTPLVDPQGFPRADIDVWTIRQTRVRIIELRNDLESVTDDIGKALQGVFDPDKPLPTAGGRLANGAVSGSSAAAIVPVSQLEAFARVDGVAPNSPAAHAGLQRGDLVVKFGELTSASFPRRALEPLVEVVNASENVSDTVLLRTTDQGGG